MTGKHSEHLNACNLNIIVRSMDIFMVCFGGEWLAQQLWHSASEQRVHSSNLVRGKPFLIISILGLLIPRKIIFLENIVK